MFLILVFLIYGGMQAYVVAKVITAFAWRGGRRRAAIAWAALMTTAPLLIWLLERCDCHLLVVSFAWLAYGWMGFSFLFVCLALVADLLGLVARLAGLPRPNARAVFVVLSVSAALLSVYGFYSALEPRVEQLSLCTSKLPHHLGKLRIVQISDVHLGVMFGEWRLRRVLARVAALRPDILVSTGDLVDGQANHLDGLAVLFQEIQPRHGKFAVTGNHEYFVGLERALAFHAEAGFTVLRGQAVEAGAITLAGVDDPGRHRPGVAAPGRSVATEEGPLLAHLPRDRFVILLKHQPVVKADSRSRFDLQLSGHVHGGQIFPFGFLVNLVYPVHTGLNVLPDGNGLYVSRGTGTWGPPMRLLAPAEVTLIELVP